MRSSSSELRQPRRVALATGWTAGHVTPALAVAAAYRAARPDVQVTFLGEASGFEQRLIAASGYRFETIPAAPLFGVTTMGRVRALSHLMAGIVRARRLLAQADVQLVIGFGAYASAGTVLGARSLGLAAVVHESNFTPGLTNRLLGRVVDRVLLGWEAAAKHFVEGRSHCSGTPIRRDLAALAAEPRCRRDGGPVRLLVCGGSQGSPFLNRHVPDLADELQRLGLTVEVHHQTGGEPAHAVQAAYAAHDVTARVEPYVEDMAAAYRWADIAVACAGAATLAELAAAGLPALLVPRASAAHDHQADNAVAFAAATGVPWVREEAWNAPTVGRHMAALLCNRDAWSTLAERSRRLARADAAATVVAECEALLTTG